MANPIAKTPNKVQNDDSDRNNDANVPWLKWGHYASRDRAKPDLLHLRVLGTETFETKYSTAVKILLKSGKKLEPYFVSLKSKASPNSKLLDLWEENVAKGRIQPGKEFVLQTWNRDSMKTSGRTVRDFYMRFDDGLKHYSSSSSSSSFCKDSRNRNEFA